MPRTPLDKKDKKLENRLRNAEKYPLPILDLGPYLSGDLSLIDKTCRDLKDIAEGIGFMCIINHGIPKSVIKEMQKQATNFFALPSDQKLALKVDQHERGYLPFRSTSLRESRYAERVQIDNYEAFNFGTDYDENNPHVKAGKRLFGRNRWPDNSSELAKASLNYSKKMTNLALKILPIWARVFNLDTEYFTPFFSKPHCYVRLIHYPPKTDLLQNEYGLGAHSDTSVMTFLPKENEPGIQILDSQGNWFWPDVPDGAIVVNFGQLLERWTNNFVRATPHRVVPSIKKHRYSLPFFFSPNLEQRVTCLPTCTHTDNKPKYKPVSFQEFHSEYMTKVYKHFEDFENIE